MRDPLFYALATSIVWFTPGWSAEFLTQAEAQRALFPTATTFNERPTSLSDEQRKQIRTLSGVTQRSDTQAVWIAHDGKDPLGFFIVDEVVGKHEFITYAVALSPQGKVIGIEILVYRETHGGQIKDAAWRKTLSGKTIADPFKLDVDVPNISGATLSCRNVINGVKRLLALQQVVLSKESP